MSQKNDGLFTDGDTFQPQVNAIPLSDVDTHPKGQGSLGDLVKDASAQVSTLVRAEVELAKTEITKSAKAAGIGAALFGAAGVILAYSSFFLFFTIAEAIAAFWPRWVAFLIVFLFMMVLVGLLAFVGFKQVQKVRKPEKTIASLGELRQVAPDRNRNTPETRDPGMFT